MWRSSRSVPCGRRDDRRICELIQSRTGIPANRIYIGFDDVQASCWGWNGSTFG